VYRKALIKVIHPSDIITKIHRDFSIESLLTNMSLIGIYTHGLLYIVDKPQADVHVENIIDVLYTSNLIREATKIHENPPVVLLVKKSFGVQKALLEVQAIRSNAVRHNIQGIKHFLACIDESKVNTLVSLIKRYALNVGEQNTRVRVKLYEKCNLKYIPNTNTKGIVPIEEIEKLNLTFRTSANLTYSEYYVLRKAYELGYFDWPRRCSLLELARHVGLSKSTALEHLRKALKKILLEYFES